MTVTPNATFCRCGRIDQHDPHYWKGHTRHEVEWMGGGRLVRPMYWCAGYVRVEGGWHGVSK
jgi:hypothetical protein